MGLWTKVKAFLLGVEPAENDITDGSDLWEESSVSPNPPADSGAGKVLSVAPEEYVDAGEIADFLKEGYTVLLNLEVVSREAARRIVDFLSGASYARDGQIIRVAYHVYLLAPCGVDVLDGEVRELDGWELQNAFGF